MGQENSGLQTSLEKLAQIVSIQNIEVLLLNDQVRRLFTLSKHGHLANERPSLNKYVTIFRIINSISQQIKILKKVVLGKNK